MKISPPIRERGKGEGEGCCGVGSAHRKGGEKKRKKNITEKNDQKRKEKTVLPCPLRSIFAVPVIAGRAGQKK